MLFISALFLWAIIGAITLSLLYHFGIARPTSRWQWILVLALSTLLLWIYARPHNDIIAGQDGPAYLHCASEYARHGNLIYSDEILSNVSPEARGQFLYKGHKSSYLTKFGSLLLPNIRNDKIKTWFQPAPSILLSAVAKGFGNRSILYVLPLFGILNGLVIAVLAMTVLGQSRSVGWTAALFYWLNPLIIWHARAIRPEFIASFLLWSGLALLLLAMRKRKRWWFWLLASLALNMAPFFHITSTMVVLPISLIVAWFIAKGNRIGLIFGAVQSLMVTMFVLQSTHLADPYSLLRYLNLGFTDADWLIWGFAAVIGWTIIGLIGPVPAKRLPNIGELLHKNIGIRVACALIVFAVVGAILFHVNLTSSSELKSMVYHYFYRTDLRSVARLVSLPIGCLAFLGLMIMLIKGGKNTSTRYAFCLVIIPAALGIGNMYDFFTTRYLIVSMIPLLTLSLVALTQLFENPKSPIKYQIIVVFLIIAGLLLQGRWLLVKQIDRKGLYEHLEQVAEEINANDGILLCEYSQVAGAIEHLFGIPTLGLDGDNRPSYNNAEKAWRKIMTENPQRKAYFITPFDSYPRSAHMEFEFIKKFTLKSSVLVDRRWNLPVDTKEWGLSLNLYRTFVGDAPAQDIEVEMSPGNMGFSRFSKCHIKSNVNVLGVSGSKSNPIELNRSDSEGTQSSEIWLILYNAGESIDSDQITIICAKGPYIPELLPLGKGWSLLRFPSSELGSDPKIWINAGAVVTQAFYVNGDQISNAGDLLIGDYPITRITVPPFVARWARQNASISIPRTGAKGSILLLFMTPPAEVGDSVTITTTRAGEKTKATLKTALWQWSAFHIPPEKTSETLIFSSTLPFNPKTQGYHDDLILFWGCGKFIQR